MPGIGIQMHARMVQTVAQMLKMELSQKLQLLLRQLLKLLLSLKLGQVQRLEQTHVAQILALGPEIQEAAADRWALDDLAHEAVRRGGITQAYELGLLAKALRWLAPADDRTAPLGLFGNAILQKVDEEVRRRRRKINRVHAAQLVLQVVLGPTPGVIQVRGVPQVREVPREPPPMEGTLENLLWLLDTVPQQDGDGCVWVLGGGWAVEILMEGAHSRDHHDIDTLILSAKPIHLATDMVRATNYFDILSCSSLFIRQHCTQVVYWQKRDVCVLRPEYLFLSKFLRAPRPQDWEDVQALVAKYAKSWDLKLMRQLIGNNVCGFTRTRELMKILATRDPIAIVRQLESFWAA